MALTPSAMVPLGFKAPSFELPEPASKQTRSLTDLAGEKGTVIVFMCNHCPFVLHIEDCLVNMAKEWRKQGIELIAISSNDVSTHPEDSPDLMAARARAKQYSFSYLYDEDQSVAKSYDAACTPDFYLFDQKLECVYRGQFDEARPGNDILVSGDSLNAAIESLLTDGSPLENQKPSLGCNIKWKL